MTTVNKAEIPDIVVGRLPRYLRVLKNLRETKKTTNSTELGKLLGYSSAQVRKDFSQFGEFGKQGTGYNIDYLINQFQQILQVNQTWDIVLIGVGNLGRAILNYRGFEKHGFFIRGAFDDDPQIIGEKIGNKVIRDIAEVGDFIREFDIKIAMIATPASEAQAVAEMLVANNIKAILTYASTILNLPPEIRVEYSDPIISLQHISYYL
ncbi:MAG TPA: redox-sensing transcriptional repressor Rex [Flexilinea sp.]|jgi:redox-sensing transcriptional repressor|nr:redox-sensing transcriptional repressor Rex [Flexilinea sp.]HOW06725.1 redox-sensing transcriptional repressor Rex [Flexilinea sp.]HPS48774.1 redox-sensing transcriptional repressor Rex [Flexilinea sp.]